MQYKKTGKDEKAQIITQIHVIGNDGKQLKVSWWTPGQMLLVERFRDHGVQLIKPDITEEEFYSILDYDGEEFLQVCYPELCEQYGIPDEN